MNVLTRISLALQVLMHGELALKNFDNEEHKVKKIINTTASVYGISVMELLSNRRRRELSEARQAAIYLALKHTKWGYADLGRFFNRDHTTVMYAEKKLAQEVSPGLKLRLETIKRKAKMA